MAITLENSENRMKLTFFKKARTLLNSHPCQSDETVMITMFINNDLKMNQA